MENNKIAVSVHDVEFSSTAHSAGIKKILFGNMNTGSALTQFAFGRLEAGERIESHEHKTMDEYFYFLKGSGTYTIGNEIIALEEGISVRIPATTPHILAASDDLEFIFFGIALDSQEVL